MTARAAAQFLPTIKIDDGFFRERFRQCVLIELRRVARGGKRANVGERAHARTLHEREEALDRMIGVADGEDARLGHRAHSAASSRRSRGSGKKASSAGPPATVSTFTS